MKQKNESKIIAVNIYSWLNTYLPKIHGYSPHTIRGYQEALTLFFTFLSSVKNIDSKTLDHESFCVSNIEQWLLWLKQERKCGNSTCNHRLTVLKSFLKYLGHNDINFLQTSIDAAEINTMRTVHTMYREITKEDIKALFNTIDVKTNIGLRDFTIFFLMYSIGARVDEILSLKLKDIHMGESDKSGYITILGKGKKYRTPPILSDVAKVLRCYVAKFHKNSTDKDSLLFFSTYCGDKKKLTQEAVNKRLRIYASKAHKTKTSVHVDMHCHDLRHARASHWLEEKLNIIAIQRLMGHSDINTTMRYIFVTNEQKKQALAMLEDDSIKDIAKKWKTPKGKKTLVEFLGLNK